jgi:hypothetical protein
MSRTVKTPAATKHNATTAKKGIAQWMLLV